MLFEIIVSLCATPSPKMHSGKEKELINNNPTPKEWGLLYIESQLAKGVISIRIPTDTDIINSKSAIRSVFFLGLFVLKRTASATPLFIRSPDIIAPAVSILSTYSSLIMMLDAQFGIIPTKAESTFASMGLLRMRFAILSSPIL
jgi:hypothetical protein